MAGDFLLRSKWWPVCESLPSCEAAVVAQDDLPCGVSSLPVVSSLNLRRFFTERPVKLVLKVSQPLPLALD